VQTATRFTVTQSHRAALLAALMLCALLGFTPDAHAQAAGGFSVPFINEFGCNIVAWMKGPLAILIFIIVCVATLVIGMIAKMDWARIIQVCVLFGIVIAIGSILSNSQYIQNVSGLSACLT
jgi:type IV secretion system protein TrbC